MGQEIIAVIRAWTGDDVIIMTEHIEHISKRKSSGLDIVGYLKIILKDPSEIFLERAKNAHYMMFYRREIQGYFVAIVKKKPEGCFLCTLHPTGKKIRNKHIVLERIK